jgi:hypothetical protein
MDRLIKYVLTTYVAVVILNALLLPPVNVISLDNLIFPLAGIAVVITFFRNKTFLISAAIIGALLTSNLLSNYINDGLTLTEIAWTTRWLKLFAIGWSTYYVFRNNRQFFDGVLLIGFLGMVVINALQLMGVSSIIQLYASRVEVGESLLNSLVDGRLFGTFINPNNNGLIMAMFGVYFFTSNFRWKLVLMSLAGGIVLMTQSRTVFLAFVSVIALSGMYFLFKSNKKKFLMFLGGMVVLLLVLVQLKFSNLSSIFNGSAFYSNSITTRYRVVEKTIEANDATPWLGQGKINSFPEFFGDSIDDEYAYVYLEYGLIGLLLLGVLVVFLSILSIRNNKVSLAALGLIILMLICGLTNLSFSNMEIGPTFAVLLVAAYALSFPEREQVIDQ